MATLRIPGTPDVPSGGVDDGRRAGGLLAVKRRGAVHLDAARGPAAAPVIIEGVTPDDVIELHIEGDVRLWMRFEDFRREFPGSASRSVGSDEIAISPYLQVGLKTRGIGALVLKALQIFDIRPQEHAARKLAERLEGGDSRLLACSLDGPLDLSDTLPKLAADQPALLFLHGTASSTAGSFGALWSAPRAAELRRLRDSYGKACFAFEHRTLSESPVRNAIDLLTALKRLASRPLHIVSHSRGGLVGELLCRVAERDRRPFDAKDLDLYAGGDDADADAALSPAVKADRRRELEELSALLDDKACQFTVKRFVRVACPARGTTLASGKLDRWLSVLANLVGRIPGLDQNPLYEGIVDLTLAVARERTNPKSLPGLEAMMPEAALVRLLNNPARTVDADLSVVAGDAEGGGFLGTLKLLIPDLFFGGDHDLVVDTRSMYGGAPRSNAVRAFFDQGAEVSHFTYFANSRTAERVVAGLTRADDGDGGFSVPTGESREVPQRAMRGPAGPRPVVFVIPGIMGSHLAAGGSRVWINPLSLATGGLRKIAIDAPNVDTQSLVGLAYGDLVEFLSDSHDVVTFPYDWRRSITEAAERLGQEVRMRLDAATASGQPLRLLAHSMGGLVARMMIAQAPELWDRICAHPQGRLVMLGTPNGGSHEITSLLVGTSGTLRKLALADLRHSRQELLAILSRFPGALEMLPDDAAMDFFAPATWARIADIDNQGWVPPARAALEAARAARARLSAKLPHADRVLYVAGWAPATPVEMEFHTREKAGNRLRFVATSRGDGRVPWATGIPEGLQTWYMADAEHGDLANHAPAFTALLELLHTGNTTRLPTAPPVAVRGVEERFTMPRDIADVMPDEDELARAAIGARRRHRAAAPPAHRVTVSVAHGDLSYARHPVIVGHYTGDTIVSAEAVLDRHLDGHLRHRLQLGLYPGAIGTHASVLQNDPFRRGGAIVVGLGQVGELTAPGLTRTVAAGVRDYVMTVAERPRDPETPLGAPRSVCLTSLLIGTGAGGLPVRESVAAILRAEVRTNSALRQAQLDREVLIDAVEFIELFGDQAIHAARALRGLESDAELRGGLLIDDPLLVQRAGARWRVLFEESAGWWQRLQIRGVEDGLRFALLTNRARAEVELVATDRSLVDQFLDHATRQPASSQETARTLFEMLLPNALKDQMPNRDSLVLVVDECAARYPWELLEDRWAEGQRPLALERGVLRQLETHDYRERVEITAERTALLIGDPETGGFATPLPGAATEVRAVERSLSGAGFVVRSCIQSDPDAILTALHANAYRVLHLAGHGVHDFPVEPAANDSAGSCAPAGDTGATSSARTRAPRRVSGMVIGDRVFLTAAAVKQMRRVPELVFINCCHLARVDRATPLSAPLQEGHFQRFAANIAAQFIEMGVRAVVAAGWAVDDAAAETFATAFYAHLLRGTPFGTAVLRARNDTYDRHPGFNTWGAYQCYGDPAYTFVPDGAAGDDATPASPVAAVETLRDLEHVAQRARTCGPEEMGQFLQRLDHLASAIRPDWLLRGDILAALGIAYGELRRFDRAVLELRRALAADGSPSVAAIEQLANFESRAAIDLQKGVADGLKGEQPAALVQGAIDRLTRLLELGRTGERLSLLGAAYKRQAQLTSGDQRRAALKKMASCYREAHGPGEGERTFTVGDPYPLLNWLTAEILYDWAGGKSGVDVARWLQEARGEGVKRDTRQPDFWAGTVAPDCDVLIHLLSGDLDQATVRTSISTTYANLHRRAASPRELSSIVEQLEFLIEMTVLQPAADRRKRLRAGLDGLRDDLTAGAAPVASPAAPARKPKRVAGKPRGKMPAAKPSRKKPAATPRAKQGQATRRPRK
ncbi:MAG: CHAT domain-containing protein [bacterium]